MYYRSHGNWWLLHHYLISVALVLRLFCVTQKRSSVVAMDTGVVTSPISYFLTEKECKVKLEHYATWCINSE